MSFSNFKSAHELQAFGVHVGCEHVTRKDQPKILNECTLPLTGKGVVDRIITDRAVIDITAEGLKLVEVAKGYTVEDIQQSTEPTLIIDEHVKLDAF